jgi:hypothetical protein
MHIRKASGQAIISLGLLIAFFVLLVVGLFSFEINRVSIARQQLTAACDAAALAAAATLASSDNVNPADAHNQCMNTALNTFKKNSIIGVSLTDAQFASGPDNQPSSGESALYIQFLNPRQNNQPVAIGDPDGKTVRIGASFGLDPAFARFLGIGTVPIYANSSGGVPSLDIALAFDVSASIDDQTPVTFVRRVWNATTNKISYIVASTSSGSRVGALAQGPIYDIIGPPPEGSAVDGLYPQQLSDSNSPNKNRWPLHFSERVGSAGSAPGLRGATDAGSPPGNFPPGTSGTGIAQTYTDLVVNIDGKNVFAGVQSSDGYNFPDLATLVEAARGNLENATVFQNSKANLSVPSNVFPRAGYQAKYFELAAANVHPLGDAQVAAKEFLTIMNTNTDAHFSFVAFTTNAGTSATSTMNMQKVDNSYRVAGSINCPVPCIALDRATGATNFSTCTNAIFQTRATSGTNIGDAIDKAVTLIKNNSRRGAKKAIVLFTDGQPTSGNPLDADPWKNARKAAENADKEGIAIYSIGLAQVPEIIPGETAILNDTNADPATGGVSAIAGHGGKFFLVTNVSNLRMTFENIARQLVQLVRS